MDNERNIEQYFVTQVRAAGGWPVKLTSQGTAGLPDRMVLWPGGKVTFVEMKRPGGTLRPLQVAVMEKLKKFGFVPLMIDCRESVDWYVSMVKALSGGDAE